MLLFLSHPKAEFSFLACILHEECRLAQKSGLIMSMRFGKHTDEFLSELVNNTEDKIACKAWHTDG